MKNSLSIIIEIFDIPCLFSFYYGPSFSISSFIFAPNQLFDAKSAKKKFLTASFFFFWGWGWERVVYQNYFQPKGCCLPRLRTKRKSIVPCKQKKKGKKLQVKTNLISPPTSSPPFSLWHECIFIAGNLFTFHFPQSAYLKYFNFCAAATLPALPLKRI